MDKPFRFFVKTMAGLLTLWCVAIVIVALFGDSEGSTARLIVSSWSHAFSALAALGAGYLVGRSTP